MGQPPKPGRDYVIGADVAEGVQGGDYSSADVLDRETMEPVCHWHGHIEPQKFGDELALLGRAYNQALIGCEANNHGHATLDQLRNTGYQRLYYHQDFDTTTRRPTKKLGWQTTGKTKPLMIDDLAAVLYEMPIHNKDTIDELMSYGVMENGSTEAQAGCFDDRVVSLAIAIQMRKRAGLDAILPGLNTGSR